MSLSSDQLCTQQLGSTVEIDDVNTEAGNWLLQQISICNTRHRLRQTQLLLSCVRRSVMSV